MAYDNTNRISIWKNKYKSKDGDADCKATINIDGVEYETGLWEPKDGASPKAPILSGGPIRRKDHSRPREEAKPVISGNDDLDDTIPF